MRRNAWRIASGSEQEIEKVCVKEIVGEPEGQEGRLLLMLEQLLEGGPDMATNFHLAPPPKTVDGLAAVPIDIQTIDAIFVFDGAASAATADATITYTVGPTAGNPIFDLRQDITTAWLDGAPFPAAQLAHHAFGTGSFTDLRVIESVQSAGSVHTLRVQYPLAMPNSQLGGSYLPALEWSAGPAAALRLRPLGPEPGALRRSLAPRQPDLRPVRPHAGDPDRQHAGGALGHHQRHRHRAGRQPLAHRVPVALHRALAHAGGPRQRHAGAADRHHRPAGLRQDRHPGSVEARRAAAVNLTGQINILKTLLADNENGYGPYLHGNRFVAFFNGSGGMEYEGGTTTSTGALLHETFHSWFARGIKPACPGRRLVGRGLHQLPRRRRRRRAAVRLRRRARAAVLARSLAAQHARQLLRRRLPLLEGHGRDARRGAAQHADEGPLRRPEGRTRSPRP